MGFSAGGTMAALAGMAANSSDPLLSTLPTIDAWVAVSAPLDWDSFADGARWGKVWMGDGDFRVTVDIVDRLEDGRPMVPSVIGQPDPRNHHPVGGMNAAWFDLWLDDR